MAAAGVAGIGIFAAPAMAGTRADISMKTIEQFTTIDSTGGPQQKTLDCGSGYTAFSGSSSQASEGVSVDAVGVPTGQNSRFRFTVAIAPGSATTGEDGPDNDQAEDPQPTAGVTHGNVKLFVTCIAEKTSQGDVYTPAWSPQPTAGFWLAQFPSPNRAVKGNRARRIVVNNDQPSVAAPAPITYSGSGTVAPHKTATVTLKCPANTFGNFALRGSSPFVGSWVVGSEPRGSSWTFTLVNFNDTANPVSNYQLGLVCVQPKTAKQRNA